MAFSEASSNWQLFLQNRGKYSAEDEREYEVNIIRHICGVADAGGTVSASTLLTNADTNAKAAVKQKRITF